jgi:isopenicillin-N epimerase
MKDGPNLGGQLYKQWLLEPGMHFLNHGSFGATPRKVLASQSQWREYIERQPVRFMTRELPGLLRQAAGELANFLGAQGEDLAFVENATAAVNGVLRSYPWHAGDELLLSAYAYPAIKNVARFVATRHGVAVREFDFPFPLDGPDAIVQSFKAALTDRTRVALLDHVSSPLSIIHPLEDMLPICHQRGVQVLVDGAHAPGMLALDISRLGADWYVGNCHKWLFAPKGCGFLWAAPQARDFLQPSVVSLRMDEGFPSNFDWTGTRDPSAWLSITAALDFYRELGGESIPLRLHAFAIAMAQKIADEWKVALPAPAAMFGGMLTLPLPLPQQATPVRAGQLHDLLWDRYQVEVPVLPINGRLWVRISAQLYNDEQDYAALAEAVQIIAA